MNTYTKFEKGNVYEMGFVTDSDLKVAFICIKVTAKTATFEALKSKEVISKRIRVYDNVEYVITDTYSMAPIINASRVIG